MSELAKLSFETLSDALKTAVVRHVPVEIKKAAADAVGFFRDRPSSEDIDIKLASVKLAGAFHQMQVTPSEIVSACMWLDSKTTFRPLVTDFVRAIEHVRAREQAREFARYSVTVQRGIERCNVTPEMVDSMTADGWEVV